jgi:hypothetical protein
MLMTEPDNRGHPPSITFWGHVRTVLVRFAY